MRYVLRAIVPLLIALYIVACGGGGSGGGSTFTPAPTPAPARGDLLFGYFAVGANQIAETAAHVNYVHTPDWGDWNTPAGREAIAEQTIAYMQEAQARGVSKAILCVGFLVFDSAYNYRGTADLVAFRQRIESLGLGPMVVALYPVDEPELHAKAGAKAWQKALPAATLTRALADIRVAWPGVKLAVTYGDNGAYPALESYDWIGKDDYGRGAGVLDRMPPISGEQRWMLVPGGTDPWAQDPQAFYDRANADARVVGIMTFVWFDNFENVPHRGVRSNGLAPLYCRIGAQIKSAPAPPC
jgi:hypothetical protein